MEPEELYVSSWNNYSLSEQKSAASSCTVELSGKNTCNTEVYLI